MPIGRRSRRIVAGIALAVAGGTAWQQAGPALRTPSGAQVAGVTYSRSADHPNGFETLGRLRISAAEVVAAAVASPPHAPPTPVVAAGEVAIAPPPDTFDAPPAPAPPPPPQLRSRFDGVHPASGTWAVMIGVNDYPGTRHDLRSAVADADDVNEALARMGVPGSQRLLVRDGRATASTIRAAAGWLKAHAGPDAVAVFFFAGHVRKIAPGVEAMVGADGGIVRDQELASILRGLQAKRTWIGMAACYGGGFTEVLGPGRVLTAAASANELAYENDAYGRSYLVEFMVRRAMIQNQAAGSVEAAFAWAKSELSRLHPERVPVQFDDDPAEIDLRQPGAAPRPASTSTTESGGSGSSGSSPSTTAPSGGGSSPGPTTTTTAPKEPDGCKRLTTGIISCGG